MKKILSALICLCLSSHLYAASCEAIISQIKSSLHANPVKACLMKKAQSVSWNSIAWLQKKLGRAEKTAVVETFYQWADSDLLVRDGRVIKARNISKEFGNYPSVELISSMLGEEPKAAKSITLQQYHWICPNSSSYLNVMVDNDRRIVNLEGQKCSSGSCTSFAKAMIYAEQNNKVNVVPNQNLSSGIKPEMLRAYNQYFKIKAENQAQLEADMGERLKNYFINLRWCRPGTYAYPLPYFMGNVLLGKAVIHGMQNKICVVETSQIIPGTNKEHHHFDMKCEYRAQDLHIFTDQEAMTIATGKGHGSQAIQKAREASCKLVYSEKEMAALQSQTKLH